MHGIPILIKDNIDTGDRMTTTAGSLALEGSIAPRDAFIARQLREAGAIILGKTNLSEWANFRSTHSSSGWSGRGGQAKNPYVLDRNPCGSLVGLRRSNLRELRSRCGRDRDGRLDRLPIGYQRNCRNQTDPRAAEQIGNHSDRAQPGHGRADGPHRRGCGDSC